MPVACVFDSSSDIMAFAVLTTCAAPEFAWCHHRQPVILPSAAAILQWLGNDSFDACRNLLTSNSSLQWHRVHASVGNMKNNGPECIKPISARGCPGVAKWLDLKEPTWRNLPEEDEVATQGWLDEAPSKLRKIMALAIAQSKSCMLNVECPICGQSIPRAEIDRHANECADRRCTIREQERSCGKANVVECPICGQSVDAQEAVQHVNACMDEASGFIMVSA